LITFGVAIFTEIAFPLAMWVCSFTVRGLV